MSYGNKRYIAFVALIWMLFPIVDLCGIFFLDDHFFAFRAWEVMVDETGDAPFRKNGRFEKVIFGDLANMLKIRKFRQYRTQRFSTDSRGFRNPDYPEDTVFPVVVLGDSDMAGSSLSDSDIFSVRLSEALSVPVYNFSPRNPISFFASERFRKNPPEILIWEAIERTIDEKTFSHYARIPVDADFRMPKRTTKQRSRKPVRKLSEHYAKWIYHDLIWRVVGIHNPAVGFIDTRTEMLFYRPGMELLGKGPRERGIDAVLRGIDRIKRICDRKGIRLIFMPLPDKENIYRHLLPDHLRNAYPGDPFLSVLHEGLEARGIESVDLFESYRNRLETGDDFLYFLDDTHWNDRGVSMAVRASIEIIEKSDFSRSEKP